MREACSGRSIELYSRGKVRVGCHHPHHVDSPGIPSRPNPLLPRLGSELDVALCDLPLLHHGRQSSFQQSQLQARRNDEAIFECSGKLLFCRIEWLVLVGETPIAWCLALRGGAGVKNCNCTNTRSKQWSKRLSEGTVRP